MFGYDYIKRDYIKRAGQQFGKHKWSQLFANFTHPMLPLPDPRYRLELVEIRRRENESDSWYLFAEREGMKAGRSSEKLGFLGEVGGGKMACATQDW